MGDLFMSGLQEVLNREAPLADRMRPQTWEEFEEQQPIAGEKSLLRRALQDEHLPSLLFYGPAGCGKTTLAYLIARSTRAYFVALNAVTAGVNDVRRVIEEAEKRRVYEGRRTILFLDEIHRFNKAQQDALLPAVEKGIITLIGSTTENPFFSLTRPLLSRLRLYRLEPLSDAAVLRILRRALGDRERGLAAFNPVVEEEALHHIAAIAGGDARVALNCLELAVLSIPPDEKGQRRVNLKVAEEACQKRLLAYDRDDEHYDVTSAFIKSMRGSDPHATLYWLARMIYAGEDPLFIARRLMIHAAEDVGLADPVALLVAVSAAQAVERVGMPEGRIILAEAALYLALAPKSNSCKKGIDKALEFVRDNRPYRVPVHLRDTSYAGAQKLGHGRGYLYPHNYSGGWVAQDYLPPEIKGIKFYHPSHTGRERNYREMLTARGYLDNNENNNEIK